MKKITDFKEISPLILKYFKRGVITNNFLEVEDYKAEIDEERLFYDFGPDWLNLYVKREVFFQLYFYALSDDVFLPNLNETLVCDVVGDGKKILEKNGFDVILERIKLEINTEKEAVESGNKSNKEDAEEIYSLLKNSFDKFTGYIPNFTCVRRECEQGLFYKYTENGKILGVLRFGKSGKTSRIKHLCVLGGHRGKGIGRILTEEFLKENPKAIVWTGKENFAAQGLYKSLGFYESKTQSIVYRKDV